jgi:hypothetical protein
MMHHNPNQITIMQIFVKTCDQHLDGKVIDVLLTTTAEAWSFSKSNHFVNFLSAQHWTRLVPIYVFFLSIFSHP